jgi:hypothetical protein
MNNRLIIAGFALLTALSFSSASTASQCTPTNLEHNQCDFEVPAMADGDVKIIPSTNTNGFSGVAAVVCKAGVLTAGKMNCGAEKASDCVVPPTTWFGGSGEVCSHQGGPRPMVNGTVGFLKDSSGKGEIEYSCIVGKAQAISSTCGTPVLKKRSATSTPQITTQSANIETVTVQRYFTSTKDIDSTPSPVIAAARAACSVLDGFDVLTPNLNITKTSLDTDNPNRTALSYVVQCPISHALRCDQGIVETSLEGTFENRTMEYSGFPSATSINDACANNGPYTSRSETIWVGRTWRNIVDEFTGVFICDGNQNACSGRPALGNPVLVTPLTCFTAVVRSGLIEVARGSNVTTTMAQNQVCGPLNFDGVSRIVSQTKEDETGAFEYYTANVECSGYTQSGSYPLLPICSNNEGVNNLLVVPTSCDEADVAGEMQLSLNTTNGQYTTMPSDEEILNTLCRAADYNVLDEVFDAELFGTVNSVFVEARCSSYSGPARAECSVLGPCYGEIVSADSQYPTLENNGVYYRDLCGEIAVPPANLCESCAAGNFSFNGTGPTSGNQCTISTDSYISGNSESINFTNSQFNGSVDLLCNNGNKTELPGAICYRNCPGNVVVGWADKNGSNSCSQRIPSGIYTHEQVVTLSSSINHTGNSSFQCNGVTGGWEVQSGQCLLDCAGRVSWGTGTSNNGVNKSNLCATNLSPVRHNSSGSLASATSMTTGSSNYQCSDGVVTQSSSSCDVSCASESVSWGGACRANVSQYIHNRNATISHGGNSSHPFPSTITGSATARCDDGNLGLSGRSCRYAVRIDTGAWSSYYETNRRCNATPDASTVPAGESFIQTTNCTIEQRRNRDIRYIYNDGSNSLIRTESQNITEYTSNESGEVGVLPIVYDDCVVFDVNGNPNFIGCVTNPLF